MKRFAIRFSAAAFAMGLTVALAGCSTHGGFVPLGATQPGNETQSHFFDGRFMPAWSAFATVVPTELYPRAGNPREPFLLEPNAATSGVYASEVYGNDIWGYPFNNNHNGKAICTVTGVSSANGIAVDASGDLIDPDGGTHTIIVFKGPSMCGKQVGVANDPYGQPADAASSNAVKGTIVVGNIFGNSKTAGSVSRCTLARGCTANLKNPNIYELGGVALAKNGDCWASAVNAHGFASLIYFKGCAGAGKKATGYKNAYYGGLDIDVNGNLVSISAFDQKLYVYKACNPKCALVGGPFKMKGKSAFGHVNQASTKFVAGDFEYGEIDVYSYAPTKVKFAYSFNRGFNPSELVEGAAYNPRSAE